MEGECGEGGLEKRVVVVMVVVVDVGGGRRGYEGLKW